MPHVRKSAVAFVILVSSVLQSNAETDREMATCAAIENSVERLACFDSLAQKRDLAAPKVDMVTSGDWQVRTETSKIDDSTNVMMLLESSNRFQSRMSGTKSAFLFITCRESSTDIGVHMSGEFLSDTAGFGNVTYRIDKNKARQINLIGSTDNKVLGLWRGSGIRFIKEMMSAETLLLQIAPYNESPVTVEFNVAGLSEAIQPLRKACNW